MDSKVKGLKIHHVGYVVSDLENTVKHFKEFYGINDFQFYDFKPGTAWSYGEIVDGYNLKIAMGTMPSGTANIEIIKPIEGEGVHKEFIAAGNNGYHHICYAVDEGYEDLREHFENEGARFVFESETEDDVIGYRRCFYAEDPNAGVIFEIKETPYFRKGK